MRTQAMGANVKMAETMGATSKVMADMNKMMNPQQVAKNMQDFEAANMKMGMTEEMMNDTLDDLLTESGDEEEQDAIVNQVLDEIGIEVSGKVREAPAAGQGKLGAETRLASRCQERCERLLQLDKESWALRRDWHRGVRKGARGSCSWTRKA